MRPSTRPLRLPYSEVLTDEKGTTCAGFLTRAAAYFAQHGITGIERVMTDNAWANKYSLREVGAALGVRFPRLLGDWCAP